MASNPNAEALIQIKASCRLRSTLGHAPALRIPNGATAMVSGFMGVRTPKRLPDELVRQRKSELSIIGNENCSPSWNAFGLTAVAWEAL